MNRSTLLLLKQARFRIVLGLVKVAVIGALFGYYAPSAPNSYMLAWIPIMVSMLGAAIMMLPTFLSKQIAPVTDRERGWIPLGVFGAMASTTFVFQVAGQLLGGMSAANLLNYWASAFPIVVYAVLAGLLMWRLVRINPGYMGFMGFAGMIPQSRQMMPEAWNAAAAAALAWWPLAALGIAFIVWEAPQQARSSRLMVPMMISNQRGFFTPPDMMSPTRKHWSTRLLDGFMYVLAALAIAAGGWGMWRIREKIGKDNPFSLFYLFILILPVWGGIWAWRQNRASGMGIVAAWLALVPRATLVLEPWRHLFGVKFGFPALCENCRRWRYAWQRGCPHCGGGAVKEKPMIPVEASGWLRGLRYDPLLLMYRVWGPIYLFFFILIANYKQWFMAGR